MERSSLQSRALSHGLHSGVEVCYSRLSDFRYKVAEFSLGPTEVHPYLRLPNLSSRRYVHLELSILLTREQNLSVGKIRKDALPRRLKRFDSLVSAA